MCLYILLNTVLFVDSSELSLLRLLEFLESVKLVVLISFSFFSGFIRTLQYCKQLYFSVCNYL